MPATSRGVYHNLKESKYAASNGEAALFFSSEFYLNKFLMGYLDQREKFKNKMKTIAPENELNFDMMSDIQFYIKVEKRGFRAWLRGVDVSCRDLDLYVLRKMIEPHSQNWRKILVPKLAERVKIME